MSSMFRLWMFILVVIILSLEVMTVGSVGSILIFRPSLIKLLSRFHYNIFLKVNNSFIFIEFLNKGIINELFEVLLIIHVIHCLHLLLMIVRLLLHTEWFMSKLIQKDHSLFTRIFIIFYFFLK